MVDFLIVGLRPGHELNFSVFRWAKISLGATGNVEGRAKIDVIGIHVEERGVSVRRCSSNRLLLKSAKWHGQAMMSLYASRAIRCLPGFCRSMRGSARRTRTRKAKARETVRGILDVVVCKRRGATNVPLRGIDLCAHRRAASDAKRVGSHGPQTGLKHLRSMALEPFACRVSVSPFSDELIPPIPESHFFLAKAHDRIDRVAQRGASLRTFVRNRCHPGRNFPSSLIF